MERAKLFLIIAVTVSFVAQIGADSAYARWWGPRAKVMRKVPVPKRKPKAPKPKIKPKAAVRKVKAAVLDDRAAARAKRRQEYVKNHDLNGDGVVDRKDRLIWLGRNKETAASITLTDENEGLLAVMDINNDGVVDRKEMQIFFTSYDTNRNGTLEAVEIDAAIE